MRKQFYCILSLFIALSILVSGCSDPNSKHVNQPTTTNNTTSKETEKEPVGSTPGNAGNNSYSGIRVKGLVLKYVLLDTADEMYSINILKQSFRTEDRYKRMGTDDHSHYIWLVKTYESLPDEMKDLLEMIFSSTHVWQYSNIVTKLDDNSDIDTIIKEIIAGQTLSSEKRNAIEKFFSYFYQNYLRDYIELNKATFDQYANEMNSKLEKGNPDIIGFMEKIAGIRFKEKYRPEFYYTLNIMSAMGFTYKDRKVSTIGRHSTDYQTLLNTPFHEFSHELFQTFTRQTDFVNVAEKMKGQKEFEANWLNGLNKSYDWVGWCEENLVDGFAKYLSWKYYGSIQVNSNYMYDYDFYMYLRDMSFDGQKNSLKEVCIRYLNEKLK